jgi:hypothetical protein
MSIAYLPFSVGTITIVSGQKAVVATAAPASFWRTPGASRYPGSGLVQPVVPARLCVKPSWP